MNVLEPFKVYEQRGVLPTFTQFGIDSLLPIIDLVLNSIENDDKKGQLNNRLTQEKDLLFNLPPLYTTLLTSRANESVAIFKKWFLNPPSTISSERMNIFLRKFFDYLPDCAESNFLLSAKLGNANDFFNNIFSFLNETQKNTPFQIEIQTNEMILESYINLIHIIKRNSIFEDKMKLFYSEKLLTSFINNFLYKPVSKESAYSIINSFAEVTTTNEQWKNLFFNLFRKMLKFEDSEYCGILFSILKVKMNDLQDPSLYISCFCAAFNEIQQSVIDNTIYQNVFRADDFLALFGDWAFISNDIEQNDVLDTHINVLLNLYAQGIVSDRWIATLMQYIFFLTSKENQEIAIQIITNSSNIMSLRPSICHKLFSPIILAYNSLAEDMFKSFSNSFDWHSFFYCLYAFIQTNSINYSISTMNNMLSKIVDNNSQSFKMEQYLHYKLILFQMLQQSKLYQLTMNQTISFLTNSISNPQIFLIKSKEISSCLLSLALAPLLMEDLTNISSIFSSMSNFFSFIMNSEHHSIKLYILMTIIACSKYIDITSNSSIIETLIDIKKKNSNTSPIKELIDLALSSLTLPTISNNSNIDETDTESYLVDDRIMSFTKNENNTQKLIIRHKHGKTIFDIKDVIPKDVAASEDTLKPNCPRMSEINIENLEPFPPENKPKEMSVKSNALKFLYCFGLASCTEKPHFLQNCDFSAFDNLCNPPTIDINISSVRKGCTSILDEPIETKRFNQFLNDIGDHVDMPLCRFKFVKSKINENPSVVFSDSMLPIKESVKNGHSLVIIVSPYLTKRSRLYTLTVFGKNIKSVLPCFPYNQKRVIVKEQIAQAIAAIAFMEYAHVLTNKSAQEIHSCKLTTLVIDQIEKRKQELEQLAKK